MKSSFKSVLFIGLLAALFVVAACAPPEGAEEGAEKEALAGQAVKGTCASEKVTSCTPSGDSFNVRSKGGETVTYPAAGCDGEKRVQRFCSSKTKTFKTCTYSCDAGKTCQNGVCTAAAAAVCGNGVLEGNEACDDGNLQSEATCAYGTTSCTACSADCTQTSSLTGSYCGDGIINGPEVCDGSDTAGQTCASQAGEDFTGLLSCQSDCAGLVTTGCEAMLLEENKQGLSESAPLAEGEGYCADALDNDGDGQADYGDSDCLGKHCDINDTAKVWVWTYYGPAANENQYVSRGCCNDGQCYYADAYTTSCLNFDAILSPGGNYVCSNENRLKLCSPYYIQNANTGQVSDGGSRICNKNGYWFPNIQATCTGSSGSAVGWYWNPAATPPNQCVQSCPAGTTADANKVCQ